METEMDTKDRMHVAARPMLHRMRECLSDSKGGSGVVSKDLSSKGSSEVSTIGSESFSLDNILSCILPCSQQCRWAVRGTGAS